MTGAGLAGIIRVDCLEQDEPKEHFKCVADAAPAGLSAQVLNTILGHLMP